MPRLDSERRRREIAEALWRVVLRDGIHAASVRNVAAEAGLSAGSLRHVFATQSELLRFAMELIRDEVRRRFQEIEESGDLRIDVERRLHSLLVLDAEARAMFDVWLAFVAQARVDPALRPLRDETHAEIREGCRVALEVLLAHGRVRADLDLPRETERLHALVDGLALHGAQTPGVTTPARQIELLSLHLDELA